MPLPLPLPRLLSVHPIPRGGGRGGGLLSIVANTKKGVPFSRRFQIYERVGITLVEVYTPFVHTGTEQTYRDKFLNGKQHAVLQFVTEFGWFRSNELQR